VGSERGQALVLGLFGLLASLVLSFGVLGLVVLAEVRVGLWRAADAAALAGAAQAARQVTLAVRVRAVRCTADGCRLGPVRVVDVQGLESALDAASGGGPPGWARLAGCTTWQVPAGDGEVCVGRPEVVAARWVFPPGSDPTGVALRYLQANAAADLGPSVRIQVLSLDADPDTGRVVVAVAAVVPWDPLGWLGVGAPTVVAQATAVPIAVGG
jgi:hypothetical protein